VAAGVGYCGLDRNRAPLRGDEIRACWEDSHSVPGPTTTDPADDWLPDIDPTAPQTLPAPGLPVIQPERVALAPSGARLWVEVDV
jgi:hypothetical protein